MILFLQYLVLKSTYASGFVEVKSLTSSLSCLKQSRRCGTAHESANPSHMTTSRSSVWNTCVEWVAVAKD